MIRLIIIGLIGLYIYNLFNYKDIRTKDDILTIWFGVPGSGKTTMAAWLARSDLRRVEKQSKKKKLRGEPILVPLSNVPIKGCRILNPSTDLGVYNVHHCRVIIDEASVEFNNRKFKTMPQNVIFWLKYHRHFSTSVDVFSQSYDDMDITMRRLAQRLYFLRKSRIPYFVSFRRIKKTIDIDDLSHQVIDAFSFVPFSKRLIFCPPLWKIFDSYDTPTLPEREWKVYE